MNIVTTPNEWLALRKTLAGKSIGFVPTMGHLHEGHLSLCERSKRENDLTVLSIFINPAQFNQASDLENYPRTLESDKNKISKAGVDYLFLPDCDLMYADNYEIQVSETQLSLALEGQYRPGHFTGMLTIVLKLLNLMQAHRAYFGEKDFQQLLLVKKMAKSLFLATDIVACETVRAEDGLALSSRNSRLNDHQRQLACQFAELLRSQSPVEKITEKLQDLGFKVDYIAEKWGRRLGAVYIDEIRLIDNVASE